MTVRDDSEACKFTACGNPLGATSGRSQACEPSAQRRQAASDPPGQASDAARSVVPQGVAPAQPAGAAGGMLLLWHPAMIAASNAPSTRHVPAFAATLRAFVMMCPLVLVSERPLGRCGDYAPGCRRFKTSAPAER